MKTSILALLFSVLLVQGAMAQNTFRAVIKDGDTKENLIGATAIIENTTKGSSADAEGIVTITGIPDGRQTIAFHFIGYETEKTTYTFPLPSDELITIYLKRAESEIEEVVVTATRGTRTIADQATRVEFVGSEELGEKGVMKPGDIRMILNESTGILTQQTSAISGNSLIRIQGLDGRYTQILKDGFPAFAGAASGLGLLQTPPLDLRQIEIIKGSSSTLYGGGAIAGLVNLVSKLPQQERDLQIHLNGTTGKGIDASAYYGQRFKKVGTTIFAAYNRNWAYDPSDVGFSAIPEFDRFTINPKVFFYFNNRTQLQVGLNAMIEDRLGGDMEYIKHGQSEDHSYFERNETQRYSTQVSFDHRFNDNSALNIKNSVMLFDRRIEIPSFVFDGRQVSTFSEASYTHTKEKTEWVAGLNLWTENFREKKLTDFELRDYDLNTVGAFVQNNTKFNDWFTLETGLRGDYVQDYGFALLPRISSFFKLNRNFSTRIGGGFGYKAPTIFSEDSERRQFQNVLPVNKDDNKLERSYGANIDINYRTSFADGKVSLNINQLFFYTYLDSPLELMPEGNNFWKYRNIDGHMHSKGAETNVRIKYSDFGLFLGYTYTDASVRENGRTYQKTLTPKHKVNAVLMYEVEDKWKIGLEGYYTGEQNLTDGTRGKDYFIFGFMIQKIWDKLSIYANFENFTDVRQTRFDTIYTGTKTDPVFRDIYAPLDGFVMNAGIILKF